MSARLCPRCPQVPPISATLSPVGEVLDSLMTDDRATLAVLLRDGITRGAFVDFRAALELAALLERPTTAPFRLN